MATSRKGLLPGSEPEYCTLQEIAETWKVSKDTVRRIFQHEAGVLFLGAKHRNTRNGRVLIRIPIEVYERVKTEMTSPGSR